jgi:hypothetical protein
MGGVEPFREGQDNPCTRATPLYNSVEAERNALSGTSSEG